MIAEMDEIEHKCVKRSIKQTKIGYLRRITKCETSGNTDF